MTSKYVLNPESRRDPAQRGMFDTGEYARVAGFFRGQPDYEPTPLRRLSKFAVDLNIGDLLVKDESARMGLNAFKILGVSYAIHRLVSEGLVCKGSVLACATDGNHGRAVARVARENGFGAHIYVHAHTSARRIQAIEGEGAKVVVVDGNYDDAVERVSMDAGRNGWSLISDTSWPGYEAIPRHVMAGYTMLLEEASTQWPAEAPPDVVLVQVGVGGLLCAVVSWLCARYGAQRPYVISCEPATAACVLEARAAGKPIRLLGSLDTIMAGLSCGHVSFTAWPTITATVDAFVSVDDETTEQTMAKLACPADGDPAITAGESGSAGIAALLAILEDDDLRPVREASGLSKSSRVLAFNTEGDTDPGSYSRIIKRELLVTGSRKGNVHA